MPVFRIFKEAPLSVCLIWTACILFVGVWSDATPAGNSFNAALHKWGAAIETVRLGSESGGNQLAEMEATIGLTHVWDGEWWRLLVDNFHHVNLIHLLLNGIGMTILGRIIEPRMSHVAFLSFIAGAFLTVGAISALTGELGIGLSGVLYALVGMLFVWRERDESVSEQFTYPMLMGAGLWLIACQILTYTEMMKIANIAHYTGFIYGWMWGQVYLEKQQKLIFRFLFGVGHLLLIPAFWFAMNPFWMGAWHYHLAFENGISNRQQLEHLQTACLRDPTLNDAWWRLSVLYEKNNDHRLALRLAMEGLKHNRGSQKLLDRTVDLWAIDTLRTKESIGPALVGQVFGEEAEPWNTKLSRQVNQEIQRMSWNPESLAELMGQSGIPNSELSLDSLKQKQEDSQPLFDPESPNSAREGDIF